MKNEQIQKVVMERDQSERKMRGKIDEVIMVNQQAQREISDNEGAKEEMARVIKNQEYEIEKLKRVIANKDEEQEIERRRFSQKWDRKVEEQEREKQEWAEIYQNMQREMLNFKQDVIDKDASASSFHNMTMKAPQQHRTLGEDNYGNLSFKGSPERIGMSSGRVHHHEGHYFNSRGNADNQGQSSEMNEMLKTKEEEIKILWNVIKEINKSKGNEKVSMEQLQQVISSSKILSSH